MGSMNIELIKLLDFGSLGGESLYIDDIDGDGADEFVFRQSAGMLQSPFYREGSGHGTISDENAALLCHSAYKQDGSRIWSVGQPWTREKPYNTHSGAAMTLIADINGDSKPVIIYTHGGVLYVVSAADFSPLASCRLTTKAINILQIFKTKSGMRLLAKGDGKSEHGYGRPLACYDSELNLLWEHTALAGGGHNIVCMDIDGDGNEEIFEGYNLLDCDGNIRWKHEFASHSDQTTVADIDGDGIMEVIYCTDNEDLVVVDVTGRHRYTISDYPHPQKVSVGKFIRDMDGLQMFMNNRATHGNSVMLDCRGKLLWDFPCGGYSSTLGEKNAEGEDLILYKPAPGRLPADLQAEMHKRAQELKYENLPISGNSGFEPMIINGRGEILYTFPFLEESIDVTKWGIPEKLKSDHGAGFSLIIHDIDKCGKGEYIFHNRHKVWIFKAR